MKKGSLNSASAIEDRMRSTDTTRTFEGWDDEKMPRRWEQRSS